MSDPASVDQAFTEFAAWSGNPSPDIVWTCAGGTSPGYFKDHTPESVEKELSTNYRTTLHTAHAAVRRMASSPQLPNREKRHLIFTSSVLAFYPIAGYSTYAPCKAAIRALADGLRQECLLWDIRVACCFPATILSPGYAQELECRPELTGILEGSDEGQTPEVVAAKCLAGLQKGQTLVTTNFLGMLMRGGSWGGSPRGNVVIDTVVGWVLIVVWAVARLVMDRGVLNYRKKLEKEGRKV
jgi:3-dehydrosphinganine reductase